jgi:hypothetical protein
VIYQVLRRFQPEIQPRPASQGGACGDVERLAPRPGPTPWISVDTVPQVGVERER